MIDISPYGRKEMERETACDGRASVPVIIAARAPW